MSDYHSNGEYFFKGWLKLNVFACKHWWEVIYKPILFFVSYVIILDTISWIAGRQYFDYQGDGDVAIYLTPVVFIYCLYTYLKNFFKKR